MRWMECLCSIVKCMPRGRLMNQNLANGCPTVASNWCDLDGPIPHACFSCCWRSSRAPIIVLIKSLN